MIIAQVCLRLATIKDHSKMCSFTVLVGSENQSVSGVTTICLTQCNTSSHRVDQVVDCGMLVHSSSMACAKLRDIGRNCQELEHVVVYPDPEHPKHAQWVTCPVSAGHARTGMFSASRNCVQILATWGCALACCKMRWRSWMNGTTMGLRISSR